MLVVNVYIEAFIKYHADYENPTSIVVLQDPDSFIHCRKLTIIGDITSDLRSADHSVWIVIFAKKKIHFVFISLSSISSPLVQKTQPPSKTAWLHEWQSINTNVFRHKYSNKWMITIKLSSLEYDFDPGLINPFGHPCGADLHDFLYATAIVIDKFLLKLASDKENTQKNGHCAI